MNKKFSLVLKTALITLAAMIAILAPLSALAGYEPANRPVKTYQGPDTPAFTYPVFNSWVNTPNYGDERAFFDAATQTNGQFKDMLAVEPGQEITLRMYIHNGAAPDLNGQNFDGPGVAKNARIQVYLPTATATQLRSFSYVIADNTNPVWVADSVDFNSALPVNLEYVPGSARLANNAHPQGVQLPDSVVQHDATFNPNRPDAAKIGYQNMDGVFPGCFQYAAFVTLKVKVNGPQLSVSKKVTTPGSTDWKENMEAKPGDITSWLIEYKNTGNALLTDGVVRDQMPANLELVPGSVTHFDGNFPQGRALPDQPLFNGGVGIGNVNPGANGYIRFRAKVKDPFQPTQCGTQELTNVGEFEARGLPKKNDNASVTVSKNTNCTPPPPPPTPPTPPTPPVTPVTPVTPQPQSLPSTGVESGAAGVLGMTGLTLGTLKYRKSKKAVSQALRNVAKR